MATNQIARIRKQAGMTQEQLAAELGLSKGQISKIEHGQGALDWERIRKLADIFECSELDIMGDGARLSPRSTALPASGRLVQVPVIGASQAGAWSAQPQFDPDEIVTLVLPDDPRYQGISRYGMEVRGTSMNRVLAPGAVAICVSVYELGKEPSPGDIVHVERRSAGGEYETTIKKLAIGKTGELELQPQSTSPQWQDPVDISAASLGLAEDTLDPAGAYVWIKGIVIGDIGYF